MFASSVHLTPKTCFSIIKRKDGSHQPLASQ